MGDLASSSLPVSIGPVPSPLQAMVSLTIREEVGLTDILGFDVKGGKLGSLMSSLLPAKAWGIVPHWSSQRQPAHLCQRGGKETVPFPHELVLHSPHQILSGALWSSSVPAPEVGSVLMARWCCLCQSKNLPGVAITRQAISTHTMPTLPFSP